MISNIILTKTEHKLVRSHGNAFSMQSIRLSQSNGQLWSDPVDWNNRVDCMENTLKVWFPCDRTSFCVA